MLLQGGSIFKTILLGTAWRIIERRFLRPGEFNGSCIHIRHRGGPDPHQFFTVRIRAMASWSVMDGLAIAQEDG